MPHTFQDRTGREWTIDLTIGTIERLKVKTQFDLYEPGAPIKDDPVSANQPGRQPTLQERLSSDWSLFWELLYRLLEPDLAAASIDAEAFGKLIAGVSLVQAKRAFWEEWSDFFRSLESEAEVTTLEMQRKVAEAQARVVAMKAHDPRLSQALSRLETKAEEAAEKELQKALSQVDQAMAEATDQVPANTSGEMPEPPALAPVNSSA